VQAVRYRTGVDEVTGKPLRGFAHVAQSLGVIWETRFGERVMRLTFGSNIRGHLGEDITPDLVLGLYVDMVEAVHTFEPEYRISDLQLVRLEPTGALGIKHSGTYYPEGRFGNYTIAQTKGGQIARIAQRLGRAA